MQTGDLNAIRLIASDLDGTLLQDGSRTPTDRAFELISELSDKGIVFLPASGRQYASLRKLFEPIADKLSYLCENGAMVMYRDTPVVRRGFSRPLGLQIAQAVANYRDAHLIISCERHAYVLKRDPDFADHLRYDVGNDVELIRSIADVREPILKVAFRTEPRQQQIAREYFFLEFGQWANVMTSGTEWTDIVPKGIDKGTALLDFGRLMGIAPQQMAAFGDNENDYGMLRLVGHPFLMENCNPRMRGAVPGATMTRTVEERLEEILETL